MKNNVYKNLLRGLFAMIIMSCATPFQQHIPEPEKPNSFEQKIDAVIADNMNMNNIPGLSIGIVKNDAVIYTQGYGFKSIVEKDLVSENTVFHTASVSKLITAQTIMKLIQQKKLNLDDTLTTVIPDLNYKDERIKKITIKNLLNHTSGLQDINNYHWSNQNRSKNSLKNYVLSIKLKLRSEPSQTYSYSNLGYDILGYVIEKITQQSFEDVAKKYVLAPYGMNFSSFNYFDIHKTKVCSPHSKTWFDNTVYIRRYYPYTREHAPSSTLNASVKDLSHWMITFLKNLEKEPELKQMIKPSFDTYKNIGLGFQLYNLKGKNAVGHFGGDKGFRSFLVMIPERKTGIVVLANCDYNEDFRQEIVSAVASLMVD